MLEYRYGSYGVQCKGGSNVVDPLFVADLPLVGSNEKASNEFCNVFGRNFGCLKDWKHRGLVAPEYFVGQKSIDGLIGEGKAVVHISANHCYDPLCPVCCYNWAKRYAGRAMTRFSVFERVYGFDCELRHVTVSVPVWDFGLSVKLMRKQVLNFALGVGVIGGLCIFHPKRYNRQLRVWYFSPHFHILGYVRGGLVDGGLVRQVHDLSGYVLKNLEKRKSVVGTVLYQLSHAGVLKGCHTITWFGELNYRKNCNGDLKELLEAEECGNRELAKKKRLCPVCGEMMVHVCRVASAPVFKYDVFEEKFVLDDVCNWVVVPNSGGGKCKRFSDKDEDAYAGYVGSFG